MYYTCVVLFVFMFMSGLWIFSFKREHILSMLLSLEYMVISIYFIMGLILYNCDGFYSLIFLTFTACEGALGLSVLVMMSRTHGGDYLKAFSLMLY